MLESDEDESDEDTMIAKHDGTKKKEIETKVAEVEKKVNNVFEELRELKKAVKELRNEKAEKYLKRVLIDNWDYKKVDDIEYDDDDVQIDYVSESESESESEHESESEEDGAEVIRKYNSKFGRK